MKECLGPEISMLLSHKVLIPEPLVVCSLHHPIHLFDGVGGTVVVTACGCCRATGPIAGRPGDGSTVTIARRELRKWLRASAEWKAGVRGLLGGG